MSALFEQGLRLRHDAYNVPVLEAAPQESIDGIYLCKNEKEVKELVEIHASSKKKHKLFIVLVGSISDNVKAVCKAAGAQPELAPILVEKDKQDDKGNWRTINAIREGYDLSEKLAHKTAVDVGKRLGIYKYICI